MATTVANPSRPGFFARQQDHRRDRSRDRRSTEWQREHRRIVVVIIRLRHGFARPITAIEHTYQRALRQEKGSTPPRHPKGGAWKNPD